MSKPTPKKVRPPKVVVNMEVKKGVALLIINVEQFRGSDGKWVATACENLADDDALVLIGLYDNPIEAMQHATAYAATWIAQP